MLRDLTVATISWLLAARLGREPGQPTSSMGHSSLWLTIVAFVVLAVVGVVWWRSARRNRVLGRLDRGLAQFSNADFTPVIDDVAAEPLASVVRRFNALGAVLRENHYSAEHNEQLLHTLIDSAPMAILLLVDTGEIEYANETARDLFFEGRELVHENFMSLLGEAKAPLRDAVLDVNDSLFTVEVDGAPETYHLAKRHFEIHGRTHTLLTVKHLTREMRRQEVDIWKKLIRVLSHELNNSLAPITSLVHSARAMTKSDQNPKLERVFCTIEERAHHLQEFVESYARFARLPSPRRAQVNVADFAEHIEALAPYARIETSLTVATAYFDRMQLEQVMINLLKNAQEAGGPEDQIALSIRVASNGVTTFIVTDRGPGMSEQVLESAMLPFYSTKERGSGLGLALCREILEAHGGTIKLANRPDGGLAVTSVLPGFETQPASAPAKLTLSRF
jgi:nitrogen fixation/metabolism regulation signal transduction histidine kinase